MIKLEVKANYRRSFDTPFYFKDIKDCNIFKHVFKDYWCNIPFDPPEEIPDNTDIGDMRKYLNMDPKERALNNLSWGNSLVKFHDIDVRDEFQKYLIDLLIKNS